MNRQLRKKRHRHIRKKIVGTPKRPRLAVFKSNKYIYAQIIDDVNHQTLVSESDLKMQNAIKSKRSYEVGKKIAEKARKIKVTKVLFDRGGFLYHGRIAEFAKGAREGGLKF